MTDVPDLVEIMVDTSRARLFGNLDELAATWRLVVDRPAGSRHPRVPQAVYPVDYGYLEGTVAADGDGVDVFRGSAVGAGVVGFLVTTDPGKRDVEVKILIDCTADEIERVRRLLDDVLGIGGLLVRRDLETPLAQTARRPAKSRGRRRSGSRDDEAPGARRDALRTAATNRLGLAEPVDPTPRRFHSRDIQVLGAQRLTRALTDAISDPRLRALLTRLGHRPDGPLGHLPGAIDQATDSVEILTQPSRRREYAALLGLRARISARCPQSGSINWGGAGDWDAEQMPLVRRTVS
ncbi:hypothetical protein [Frankia nepalensis]|uniref:hypothetical protein n=1 Tax=Frankia nepalensis TaxID=1836974 RepID=UPI001EE4B171|nr:hypothetical protein [Frankia nepalensis]